MPKIRRRKPKNFKKRSSSKKSGKGDSFRVKLEGLITPAELRIMLNEAVDEIEALGATHLRHGYLYATPADSRGERVTLRDSGRIVSEIIIDPPYRSAADEHGV